MSDFGYSQVAYSPENRPRCSPSSTEELGAGQASIIGDIDV